MTAWATGGALPRRAESNAAKGWLRSVTGQSGSGRLQATTVSSGGSVSAAHAARRTARIGGVIPGSSGGLMIGAPSVPRAGLRRAVEPRLAEETKGLLPAEAFIRSYVRSAYLIWADLHYDGAPFFAGSNFNPALHNMIRREWAKIDTLGRLGEIAAPVYLFMGAHDYVFPPTLWDGARERLRDCTYRLFERAGHNPQIEDQDPFDRELLAWLERHEG